MSRRKSTRDTLIAVAASVANQITAIVRDRAPSAYSLIARFLPLPDDKISEAPAACVSKRRSKPQQGARANRKEARTPARATKAGARAKAKPAARPGDGLLSVKAFASHTKLSSDQMVRNWIKRNQAVGWKDKGGRFVLPAEQINGQRWPLKGLSEVLPIFGNHQQAWQWLCERNPDMDGKTPLALLRSGSINPVRQAAEVAQGRVH